MILEMKDVHTYYGTSHVLFGVSLDVDRGEVVCLMGRNGAGKSTTFRTVMGLTPARAGTVLFQGKDVTRLKVHTKARLGIGYVPEDRQIFPELTVRENLDIGRSSGIHRKDGWDIDRIYGLFPVLEKYDRKPGGQLSGGEQQMLTIARTLMGNPELVLLDEPTEGLAPVIVIALKEMILRLKEMGTTILLSEQNVKFAVKVSDRVFIIDNGAIRYNSDIKGFVEDELVQKRYLAV
ncbi:MAG: ABC transporter ATP-binding protein [Deltaproteobacteria bacterium]|uniref:ABC transporter ATP-binding protein n=1 Tax=Candidatus Deferrimicrobium sp. TaxID=3060586 RepID=UPI00271D1856|nr:ABC transporter ATP-binding protein [Candidatus Deferrimicrobium sp.]MCR4308726.1 ABC transporter ATP-binding protein [Deltaproteobacteria bacterium]MDO8737721.1 ABC transporter ATP-binding protein [Candidatus Deferrimicrobium sp.]MDP2658849.1 ABC transporter ATP-binding protein [Candidatus Deferrimicrobium sp.]